MGLDLTPINKECEVFRIGVISWQYILDTGAGYFIGYGRTFDGDFLCEDRGDGSTPVNNYGYYVSDLDCLCMYRFLEGLLFIENNRDEKSKMIDKRGIEQIELLIPFLENCRGFNIN